MFVRVGYVVMWLCGYVLSGYLSEVVEMLIILSGVFTIKFVTSLAQSLVSHNATPSISFNMV